MILSIFFAYFVSNLLLAPFLCVATLKAARSTVGSDSVIGMYDLVSKTFLTNAGTGTFTKGNNVSIPNPDYPQDIHSVSGDNEIEVCGKNLWNDTLVTTTGIIEKNATGFKITRSSNSRFSPDYVISLPVGSYKMYGSFTTNALTTKSGFIFYYEDTTTQTYNFDRIADHNTIVVAKNVTKIRAYIDNGEAVGTYYDIKDFMIFLVYIPYLPFRKKGVYWNGNFAKRGNFT